MALIGSKHFFGFKPVAITLLVLAILASSLFAPGIAKKKKKKDEGPDPAVIEQQVKEMVDPLSETIIDLLMKSESRQFFSPEDSGKLAEIKYGLMDVMTEHPKHVLIAKPIYQAGVLYIQREQYEDAYQMFSFLKINLPKSPYSARAQAEIRTLKARFGDDYFTDDLALETEKNSEKDGKK